jgi:hypothetical protein
MNITEDKHGRGWNRKGFKYDRNSDEYKKYKEKKTKSFYKSIRKRLTAIAKAPAKRSNKKKIA